MANAEEVNRIIERAKAGGVDMSWLKAPQVQATGGVGRISPGASQLMDAVRQAQAATPVYMPFPGGTPTQRRREADESSRQFDVGQEFSREQWDWQKGFQERQFAADQAYRNAQLALSRAARMGGGAGVEGGYLEGYGPPEINIPAHLKTQSQQENWLKTQGTNRVAMLIDGILADGGKWEDIRDTLTSPAGRADLSRYLLTDEEVLSYAFSIYEKKIKSMPSQRPLQVGYSPTEIVQSIVGRAGKAASYGRDLNRAKIELGRLTPQQEAEIAKSLKLTPGEYNILKVTDPDGLAKLYLDQFSK